MKKPALEKQIPAHGLPARRMSMRQRVEELERRVAQLERSSPVTTVTTQQPTIWRTTFKAT